MAPTLANAFPDEARRRRRNPSRATTSVAVSAPATTLVPCPHAHQHVAHAVEPTTLSCLMQASACDEPEKCRWPWPLPIVLVEVGRVESVGCSCVQVGPETRR
jgi:hypothetical protein